MNAIGNCWKYPPKIAKYDKKWYFVGLGKHGDTWNHTKVLYKFDTWSSEGFSVILFIKIGIWRTKVVKMAQISTKIAKNRKLHFVGLGKHRNPWNLAKVVYKIDTWSSEGFSAIFFIKIGSLRSKIVQMAWISTKIAKNGENCTLSDLGVLKTTGILPKLCIKLITGLLKGFQPYFSLKLGFAGQNGKNGPSGGVCPWDDPFRPKLG